MTIKEKLREIKELDRRIDILLRQIDDERERIKAVDYSSDRVMGGSGGDLTSTLIKIEKYVERLNAQIDELVERKDEMKTLVDSLDGPYWDVINLYYFVGGSTWEKVAVKLNYSYPQVQWIHGRALRKLDIEFKQKVNTK